MRIAFFETEGWEEKMVREKLTGQELFFSGDKIDAEHIPADTGYEAISVFVNSRITAEVLEKFPNLKLVATRSTGFDHIDVAAARAKGIEVVYVPGYGDNTVAEYAMGLLLSLTRKIYQAVDQVKENGSFGLKGLRGMDLNGKTMGIIGTGRIGKEMIKISQGFGMKVLAHDAFPDEAYAQRHGFNYADLPTLLGRADTISIHCPLTPQTQHLINKSNLNLFKKGVYLINTARGPIVETEALVAGLEQGIFGGVGIDVLEEEGEMRDEMEYLAKGHSKEEELRVMLSNHVLMHLPNVLVSPHNAFNSQEALERILGTTLDNMAGFVAGSPKNVVPQK